MAALEVEFAFVVIGAADEASESAEAFGAASFAAPRPFATTTVKSVEALRSTTGSAMALMRNSMRTTDLSPLP